MRACSILGADESLGKMSACVRAFRAQPSKIKTRERERRINSRSLSLYLFLPLTLYHRERARGVAGRVIDRVSHRPHSSFARIRHRHPECDSTHTIGLRKKKSHNGVDAAFSGSPCRCFPVRRLTLKRTPRFHERAGVGGVKPEKDSHVHSPGCI